MLQIILLVHKVHRILLQCRILKASTYYFSLAHNIHPVYIVVSHSLHQFSNMDVHVTYNMHTVVIVVIKWSNSTVSVTDTMAFSKLTLHQAKRYEMESQVRVLELQCDLEKERVKLSELRKTHYQLAGESEGWEQEVGDGKRQL